MYLNLPYPLAFASRSAATKGEPEVTTS
jgi:hypothetical protein